MTCDYYHCARLQLGVRRVPLQDVSIRARAQLHRLDIHPHDNLHGTILRNHISNYVQADTDNHQAAREYTTYPHPRVAPLTFLSFLFILGHK